jgi:hypothetical protein
LRTIEPGTPSAIDLTCVYVPEALQVVPERLGRYGQSIELDVAGDACQSACCAGPMLVIDTDGRAMREPFVSRGVLDADLCGEPDSGTTKSICFHSDKNSRTKSMKRDVFACSTLFGNSVTEPSAVYGVRYGKPEGEAVVPSAVRGCCADDGEEALLRGSSGRESGAHAVASAHDNGTRGHVSSARRRGQASARSHRRVRRALLRRARRSCSADSSSRAAAQHESHACNAGQDARSDVVTRAERGQCEWKLLASDEHVRSVRMPMLAARDAAEGATSAPGVCRASTHPESSTRGDESWCSQGSPARAERGQCELALLAAGEAEEAASRPSSEARDTSSHRKAPSSGRLGQQSPSRGGGEKRIALVLVGRTQDTPHGSASGACTVSAVPIQRN